MNKKIVFSVIAALTICMVALGRARNTDPITHPGDFRDAVAYDSDESLKSADFETGIPAIEPAGQSVYDPTPSPALSAGPAEISASDAKASDKKKESFAVPYRVTGTVKKEGEGFSFVAADGRTFKLLPASLEIQKKAAQLAQTGISVTLDGWARRLDDLSAIRADAFLDPASNVTQTWRDKTQREPDLASGGAGAFTVNNVRWGKTAGGDAYDWRTTVINPALVENVYIIQKPFPPEIIASHAVMLFTFKAGGVTDSSGNSSRGLLLSVEAMLRSDKPVDLISSLKKEFHILWLLTTEEDYINFTCGVENKKLLPYELLLSPGQKRALLEDAITQAVINRRGEYYHTITNNCIITLIQLLNKVLPEASRIPLFYNPALYNPQAAMPNTAFSGLVKKGLAAPHIPELTPANYKDTSLWPK